MMTEQATPAAPATPETPAAPATDPNAAAPATPAVKGEQASLMDGADPNAAPTEPTQPQQPAPQQPAADEAKWYLAENKPGDGEPPDWFKADKYKTVDEQAKAYVELEKRLGAFTGAPKDGVYKINPPEGIQVEFDTDHELFQELNQWAKESQVSQKAYDDIIGMFAKYEASLVPDMASLKSQLGENADARLNSVAQWAKSNLSTEEYQAFREAQTQQNAAQVFKAFEAVINKTRAPQMPKAGDDVTGAVPGGLAEINEMQNKKDANGKRLYETDPEYRAKVEQMRMDWFKAQEKQQ